MSELARGAGRKLLVVENDAFIADDLCEELKKLGLIIIGPARGVVEANELIDAADWLDAAVLNLGLRDGDSIGVADRLRARGVPFVFASGHMQDVLPDEFADVAYFTKPADPMAIFNALFPEPAPAVANGLH